MKLPLESNVGSLSAASLEAEGQAGLKRCLEVLGI